MSAPTRPVLRLARVAFHPDSAKSVIPLLIPEAAEAIRPIAHLLVVGSCFRPPGVSRRAYLTDRAKPAGKRKGVARPGDSGHGVGICLDLDVRQTLRVLYGGKFFGPIYPTYKALLDTMMAARGWWCYRGDAKDGREAWHYTFDADRRLGDMAIRVGYPSNLIALRINVIALDAITGAGEGGADTLRGLLKLAGHDPGAGAGGEQERRAVRAFQRAWTLPVTGELGSDQVLRCLVAVTAVTQEVAAA